MRSFLRLWPAAFLLTVINGCPYLRSLQDGPEVAATSRSLQDEYGVEGGPGQTIQNLFDNHDKISRDVTTNSDSSIRTTTTSSDAQVAGWIKEHVVTMKSRVDSNQRVRSWDPFFVALFDHRAEWQGQITNLNDGVQADLSATTECGQDLIEGHTEVVSLFVSSGHAEGQKSHDAPSSCGSYTGGGGSSGGGLSCFSANAKVEVLNQGSTSMEDLKVGDYILTGNHKYQPVYAFGHRDSRRSIPFLKLVTSLDQNPLEISAEHLVFLHGKSVPTRADSIRVGDLLESQDGPVRVSKISTITQTGLYAPLTKDGTILVDGIVTSAYADLFGGYNIPFSQQKYIQHGLSPFRLFCHVSSDLCNAYNENGMPHYVSFGIWVTEWAKTQHVALKFLFLVLYSVLTCLCFLLEIVMNIPSGVFTCLLYAGAARLGVRWVLSRYGKTAS